MTVYSRLYLRNFHYSQYFVIAHAHCKRVCWMLLGVMWINKISIYLSVGYYLCSIGGKTHRWRHQSALYHYKTNRFYVVVRLFSWVAHEAQPSVSLMFSPRCDIILIHCLTHARQHRIYSQIGSCSIDEISIDNWLHIFAHFQGVSRRSLFRSFLHIFWQNLQGDCFALQSCH